MPASLSLVVQPHTPHPMTKNVRIENADASTHAKVRVTVQHKNHETGEWTDSPNDSRELSFPTHITDIGIHSHRRLIVEEYV